MDLNNPKTILVVQIGKVGDMILTTPLFHELKKLFPASKIKVLSSNINKDIAVNSKSADEVLVYNGNFLKDLSLLSKIGKPDLWIDTKDNYSRTSELLVKIFKPVYSMGYNFNKKIFDIDLTEFKKFSRDNHAISINLAPINYFEKKPIAGSLKPSFQIPEKLGEEFRTYFAQKNGLKILINISAGNKSRNIPKETWLDILKKIQKNTTSHITLMGLERDIESITYLLNNLPSGKTNYISTKNIIEAAAIVEQNNVVITPDTSIVHICSAFNIPVLAIYPDVKWNTEKFAPLSDNFEIVISKSSESITEISEDDVVKGFFKLSDRLK